MKRQEFGDLFVFVAVADASSFTQAAERLGTTQPVVSQAIRRLEDRFGPLAERGPAGVTGLTVVGRGLAEELRPVLASIQAIVDLRSE
ncbi:LysR family transcriptional regulator [Brevundimonas sp. NIBR10]|uniref:helix-turn-helix domain-containing protein n=1 Tax=Brevundimonas sp. NIBR10 TaxID=3015997 RepID=UPI0022F1502F|nr:LysR family transcriptional regulator [Brevundimonas sp. NIBR10]